MINRSLSTNVLNQFEEKAPPRGPSSYHGIVRGRCEIGRRLLHYGVSSDHSPRGELSI